MKYSNPIKLALVLSFIAFVTGLIFAKPKIEYNVDLVIFSKDRPVQLYSCLESIKKYISGVENICVLYETSNSSFETAYQTIKNDFPEIEFFKQNSVNVNTEFKTLLLKILSEKLTRKYLAFVRDNIIVKDYVDLHICCDLMHHENAHGFYLLPGKNVLNERMCAIERVKFCHDGVWKWNVGDKIKSDFGQINNFNMTVYRKSNLIKLFKNMHFDSSDKLENEWNKNVTKDKKGLFFDQSKVVDIALTEDFNNAKLLTIFNADFKMDITSLHKINNKLSSIRYEPSFILRNKNVSPFWDNLINFQPEQDKHIVVVIASYNNEKWYKLNLDSVLMQKYKKFHVIYVDDKSSDETASLVEKYINKNNKSDKILLIKNKERCGAMANLYKSIHSCAPTDIVVILDGDDWFATDHALELINKVYNKYNVLLTYGDYVYYPEKMKSICDEFPKEIIENRSFRSYKFLSSHLRTFYAGLFQKIKIEDLMYEGKFFAMACDVATMIPMLEMCNNRFMFIKDILCVHNRDNPINDNKVDINYLFGLHRYIRGLPQYPVVEFAI